MPKGVKRNPEGNLSISGVRGGAAGGNKVAKSAKAVRNYDPNTTGFPQSGSKSNVVSMHSKSMGKQKNRTGPNNS